MSADGHTVCPACHPDLLDYTGPEKYPLVPRGVIDHAAEERGYDRSVRENYEFYLKATEGKLYLHVDYEAACWTCDWTFTLKRDEPVEGLARGEDPCPDDWDTDDD